MSCDLIFPFHTSKMRLVEVKEAMYKGFDSPPELIFYFLTSRKCYLRNLEKAMFQGVPGSHLLIS